MSYKNQDRSWRRGSWCGLHLTLNAESLGGGSVSRYSGKLVRTLSALEQYFHRKTTRMVATVLKIPNIISFCQAKATWPLLRSLLIKTFLQFCSMRLVIASSNEEGLGKIWRKTTMKAPFFMLSQHTILITSWTYLWPPVHWLQYTCSVARDLWYWWSWAHTP